MIDFVSEHLHACVQMPADGDSRQCNYIINNMGSAAGGYFSGIGARVCVISHVQCNHRVQRGSSLVDPMVQLPSVENKC